MQGIFFFGVPEVIQPHTLGLESERVVHKIGGGEGKSKTDRGQRGVRGGDRRRGGGSGGKRTRPPLLACKQMVDRCL